MSLTYGRVSQLEAASALLELFAYAEQKWCQWDKLEETIARVKYEKLDDEELDWFIEFMSNACFRVWRSTKEDPKLNQVKEENDCFFIENYDWHAFKFSRQKAVDKEITTKQTLCVPKSSLSEAEIKWLRSKCK